MREQAAREVAGRPDGTGSVSTEELARADAAIARAELRSCAVRSPPLTFDQLAKLSGRPQIPGLNIVYLHPLGRPADANTWRYIIAHQTEGPAGAARSSAMAQFANPTKRGRHAVGGDRRHGLLGDRRERDPDPWRWWQPQRQQVHRQFEDLPHGGQDQFGRGGIRRQFPRRGQAGDARAGEGLAGAGALLAGALRHLVGARLCTQLDRL